jgi:hypothetical protein
MKVITLKLKNNILLLAVTTFILTSFLSSCQKDEDVTPVRVPLASVIPADKGVIEPMSSLDLKWTGTSGTKYNLYFGEETDPQLFKGDLTSQAASVPVTGGKTYYWRIGTFNSTGQETISHIYSFRVKAALDIEKFTGLFNCDEPKYTKYDVTFTKIGKDTLENDNFWDLAWKLKYVFDDMGKVNIIPSTFQPDENLKVSVTGSGTFDAEKNVFNVTYVVLQDASTASPLAIEIDRNTHSFVKK